MALSTPLGIKFAQTIAISSRDKLLKATRPTHFSLGKLFSSKASGDACTIEDGGNPITGNTKHENRRIRRNLALAYRLLNRLELNEGVCNHLTAMAPCQTSNSKQTMLVIPGSILIKNETCRFSISTSCYIRWISKSCLPIAGNFQKALKLLSSFQRF